MEIIRFVCLATSNMVSFVKSPESVIPHDIEMSDEIARSGGVVFNVGTCLFRLNCVNNELVVSS